MVKLFPLIMEAITDFNNMLHAFRIKASCVNHMKLNNYMFYDLKLDPKARVKDITKYSDEISLALKVLSKPSIKILHDEGIVRLEFATPHTAKLKLFDYFTNHKVPKGEINCLLGQKVDGHRMWMDLAQNPHLLIAGTTGSGKSVLLHNLIANLLNYNNVDIYLVDSKQIEFNEYKCISNICTSSSYEDIIRLFSGLIEVMEDRYDRIRVGQSKNTIKPIVIIVDEFADIIMQDKNSLFYTYLCRLAQKCRAARIHIILATQRPSVDVVSGVIKANFPARIACRTASHVDSKVILNSTGAESLLGKGDALLRDNYRTNERFQIAYTDAAEVCSVFGS